MGSAQPKLSNNHLINEFLDFNSSTSKDKKIVVPQIKSQLSTCLIVSGGEKLMVHVKITSHQ